MSDIQNFMSQSWVGTVIGLAGIVLAFVFYVRSKKRAQLAFQHDHVMLLGGRGAAFPDEVEIRFAGTVVPRITAGTVILWNSGNRTVDGSDVVTGDKLRLQLPDDGRILKYTITRQTRSVNGWRIEQPSPNALEIAFDFLDPGDGVTLEVIHSRAGGDLQILGTLRGMPGGLRRFGRSLVSGYDPVRSIPSLFGSRRLVFVVVMVLGLGMTLYGVVHPQVSAFLPAKRLDKPIDPAAIRWVFVVGGLFYAALPASVLWSRRRRYPSALEPRQEQGTGKTHA